MVMSIFIASTGAPNAMITVSLFFFFLLSDTKGQKDTSSTSVRTNCIVIVVICSHTLKKIGKVTVRWICTSTCAFRWSSRPESITQHFSLSPSSHILLLTSSDLIPSLVSSLTPYLVVLFSESLSSTNTYSFDGWLLVCLYSPPPNPLFHLVQTCWVLLDEELCDGG